MARSRAGSVALLLVLLLSSSMAAQSRGSGRAAYSPPRTPWGDPDLQGIYTNKDEANTPLERPDQFTGKRAEDFTAADLANCTKRMPRRRSSWSGRRSGRRLWVSPLRWKHW